MHVKQEGITLTFAWFATVTILSGCLGGPAQGADGVAGDSSPLTEKGSTPIPAIDDTQPGGERNSPEIAGPSDNLTAKESQQPEVDDEPSASSENSSSQQPDDQTSDSDAAAGASETDNNPSGTANHPEISFSASTTSGGCNSLRQSPVEGLAADRPDPNTITVGWAVCVDPAQGNCDSTKEAIAGSGRFVAYLSCASNLAPQTTSDQITVLVHDRLTGETQSVLPPPTSNAGAPVQSIAISGDGNVLAVAADFEVFRFQRDTGQYARLSAPVHSGTGCLSLSPAVDAAGSRIAFVSSCVPGTQQPLGHFEIFLYDHSQLATRRIVSTVDGLPANMHSVGPHVSRDGNSILFSSWASNLVADDSAGTSDIFQYSLAEGSIVRLSEHENGTGIGIESVAPTASSDGTVVAFEAAGLIIVREGQALFGLASDYSGERRAVRGWHPTVSADGHGVLFLSDESLSSADVDASPDLYRFDLDSRGIDLVSNPAQGWNETLYLERFSVDDSNQYIAVSAPDLGPEAADTTNITDVALFSTPERSMRLISRNPDWTAQSRLRVEDQDGAVLRLVDLDGVGYHEITITDYPEDRGAQISLVLERGDGWEISRSKVDVDPW